MCKKIYVVMYHYVRDLKHSRYPGIKGLDVSLFEKQIDFFANRFRIIKMEDLIAYYTESYELPDNSLLLTFDDGYIDNYSYVLPILNEYGVQGSFFIPGKTFSTHQLLDVNKVHYILASANIEDLVKDINERLMYYRNSEFKYESLEELYNKYAVANRFDDKDTIYVKRLLQTALPEKLRNIISSELFQKYVGINEEKMAYELYMSEKQILFMKKQGMHIGIHGYDHYWLANLNEMDMKNDIDKAIEVMKNFIDKKSWVMNYPYGNYSDSVISYIMDKGCSIGLSTEVRVCDLSIDNRFALPRCDCNDFPPVSNNYISI